MVTVQKPGLEIINPGFIALLQDGGRQGVSHLGITEGGALDEFSFYWANILVGNEKSRCCIESVMGGMEIRSQVFSTIALTGAQASLLINGVTQPMWQSCYIKPQDIIAIGHVRKGLRCYLSIAGGFLSARQWGSCATVSREQLGGLKQNGSPLATADFIDAKNSPKQGIRSLNSQYIPVFPDRLHIRLLPGYQFNQCDNKIIKQLLHTPYMVSADSNRAGIKLHALHQSNLDLQNIKPYPQGVCFGTLQLPADGQPIIMLKDRHTISSVLKLGSILPIDCFKLSQLMLGSQVTISLIDANKAVALMRKFKQQFQPFSQRETSSS